VPNRGSDKTKDTAHKCIRHLVCKPVVCRKTKDSVQCTIDVLYLTAWGSDKTKSIVHCVIGVSQNEGCCTLNLGYLYNVYPALPGGSRR
jgi:hypothetical protein